MLLPARRQLPLPPPPALTPVSPLPASIASTMSGASSASRRIRLTSSRKMFSRSESSVTAVLRCLFPRSRKRRHFGDDLGWHLNLGFFFLIWRPVNFRHLR